MNAPTVITTLHGPTGIPSGFHSVPTSMTEVLVGIAICVLATIVYAWSLAQSDDSETASGVLIFSTSASATGRNLHRASTDGRTPRRIYDITESNR